jgi:nucleoside-diphosphate-sugar epimerase
MCHALYGTPVVTARLALAYGPGQAARKVIPSTILSLLRGHAPRLSTGTRPWDFVYVDDAIEALVRLVEGHAADGSTVDIGTCRTEPLRAVVERLVEMIDPGAVPAFGAVPDRPLTEGRAADAAATEACLGWRATTTLERGLQRTIDWYRSYADSYAKDGVPA